MKSPEKISNNLCKKFFGRTANIIFFVRKKNSKKLVFHVRTTVNELRIAKTFLPLKMIVNATIKVASTSNNS